jgi:DNA-directed RNA polymerase subunit RPC12/RpoP
MTGYEYRCTWCQNKVILNVDHSEYMLCPICERRTLERKCTANDQLEEIFKRFIEKHIREISLVNRSPTTPCYDGI